MKKFLLGFIGFLLAFGGGILGIILFCVFLGDDDAKAGLLVVAIILLVLAFIGSALRRKAKLTCWCGGKGHEIGSSYLGKEVRYDDRDSGFDKNITKKYAVHIQCAQCGKRWTLKVKDTTTERHRFRNS